MIPPCRIIALFVLSAALLIGNCIPPRVFADDENSVTVYVVYTWKNERDKRLNAPDPGPERTTQEEAEQAGRQLVAGGRAFDFVIKPENRKTIATSISKRPNTDEIQSILPPKPGGRSQLQMDDSPKRQTNPQITRSRNRDDSSTLKSESEKDILSVYQRDGVRRGKRPTIDEARLNAETERILAERKVDRQIRDATKEIETLQQDLKQKTNQVDELRAQLQERQEKGPIAPSLTFSEKRDLESAAARVQKAQQAVAAAQNLRVQGYRRTFDERTDARNYIRYNLQVYVNQNQLTEAIQELEAANLQYTQLQQKLEAKLKEEANDSAKRLERNKENLKAAQEEVDRENQGLEQKKQQLKKLQTQKSSLAPPEKTTSQEFTSPQPYLRLNESTQKTLRQQTERRRREP